jgi:hypothetical protein
LIGKYEIPLFCPGMHSTIVIGAAKDAHKRSASSPTLKWDLSLLLRHTRKFEATDPRDKIFALVGLVLDKESLSDSVRNVDYSMSTKQGKSISLLSKFVRRDTQVCRRKRLSVSMRS